MPTVTKKLSGHLSPRVSPSGHLTGTGCPVRISTVTRKLVRTSTKEPFRTVLFVCTLESKVTCMVTFCAVLSSEVCPLLRNTCTRLHLCSGFLDVCTLGFKVHRMQYKTCPCIPMRVTLRGHFTLQCPCALSTFLSCGAVQYMCSMHVSNAIECSRLLLVACRSVLFCTFVYSWVPSTWSAVQT